MPLLRHTDWTLSRRPEAWCLAVAFVGLWVLLAAPTLWPLAAAPPPPADRTESAAQARAMWESGAVTPALDLLEQEIHQHPEALALLKLRGDILSTARGPQEAVAAYEAVLAQEPDALAVRWAKWSVLVRWGQTEEALAELRRLADRDPLNPLVQLRLAQDLRKVDRLEESLSAYERAVALAPDLLGWRLALARARFDLLDYAGADRDIQYVLDHMPPGSPLELPANNLRTALYGSMDRGRRFTHAMTPDSTAERLKEWAAIRADAWKLFAAGRYAEAEPVYRRLLALNPHDSLATHQLGVTLMQLNRCQDALDLFGTVLNLNPSEEDYADTVFRMGQCYVTLERWEDAYVHFQLLYDTAVEFEERNKGVPLPEGTRVLDKAKLAAWLDKVRPHVPEPAHAPPAPPSPAPESDVSEEELLRRAVERLKPQQTLETRASLLGRDADFSWFRFVIPAAKVMRDDFPTGAHEFIPLNPNDSFAASQPDIYLVFSLVSASYDAVPLSAQCVLETAEMSPAVLAQDRVMTAMNDQSGYFLLTPPVAGWTPGLYRCGLFAGERTSAYTQVDEVRFRIVEPRPASAALKGSRPAF